MNALGRGCAARPLLIATLVLGGVSGCRSRPRLLPRADGAAVVVVVRDGGGAVEPGVTYGAEAEPNGTLATAQKLDLGAGAVVGISAAIGPEGKDVDLYRVVVPA